MSKNGLFSQVRKIDFWFQIIKKKLVLLSVNLQEKRKDLLTYFRPHYDQRI